MERTICDCQKCQSFCRRPGYLVPDDVPAIAEYLGMSTDDLRQNHLTAGKGTLYLHVVRGMPPIVMHAPTLVPKSYDGWCQFFNVESGHCYIHPVAPFGCRMFDDHISPEEFETRRQHGLRLILQEDGVDARTLSNTTMPT